MSCNKNVYVGKRYVPKIIGLWDNTLKTSYEGLSIVTWEGNSYTSKKFVPAGVDIKNKNYWALTGNYNAQIEEYRKEVQGYGNRIEEVENQFGNIKNDVNNQLSDNLLHVNNLIQESETKINVELENTKHEINEEITKTNNNITGIETKISNYRNIYEGYTLPPTEELKENDIFLLLNPLIKPDTYFYKNGDENINITGGFHISYIGTNYVGKMEKTPTTIILTMATPATEEENSTIAITTREKIDVTNLNTLNIEWQNTGEVGQENMSRFGLTDIKNGLPNIACVIENSVFNRKITRLDVSNITGEYWLEVGARMENGKDSIITIFNIWGL